MEPPGQCRVGHQMRGRVVAKNYRRFVIPKDSQSLFFLSLKGKNLLSVFFLCIIILIIYGVRF